MLSCFFWILGARDSSLGFSLLGEQLSGFKILTRFKGWAGCVWALIRLSGILFGAN